MIDCITGERVVVFIHPLLGPSIKVYSFQDAGALRDLFDDEYNVLYWMRRSPELSAHGGCEYNFGAAADPLKIQVLLDTIAFDWSNSSCRVIKGLAAYD